MHRSRVWRLSCLTVVVLFLVVLVKTPVAAQSAGAVPAAAVTITADRVLWTPQVANAGALLTISGPGTYYQRIAYAAGVPITFSIADTAGSIVPDGLYHYELRLIPPSGGTDAVLTQSGSFSVLESSFVIPTAEATGDQDSGGNAIMDVVTPDDAIIQSSLCVGMDCVNGEDFGFDTIRLKENNLRIHFQDTSSTGGFPTNDWTMVANDTTNGGANYFALEDTDRSRYLFVVEAGGPANALYVDDAGRVGLGTSTPAEKLQVWDDDTPTIRLDQSGGGWTSQTWDVGGNEAYYFVRDVTHGSVLPLRIEPGAPTSSLNIKSDGSVGLGTWNPGAALEVERTSADAALLLDRTDGAQITVGAGALAGVVGTVSDDALQVVVDDALHTTFETNGDVTIENGVLIENSNVMAKENFASVDAQTVLATLADLPVLTWNFKADEADIPHMGPVAQDFYAAFGLGSDPEHIAPIDTNGVALAAIQGLYETIQQQGAEIAALQAQNADLEARLATVEQAVGAGRGAHLSVSALLPWFLGGALPVGAVAVLVRRRDVKRSVL